MIRKRNGKYLVVIPRGYGVDANGKRCRLEHSRTFEKKKDATRWEMDEKQKLASGNWIQPRRTTLRQFYAQWKVGALAIGEQSDRTKADYCRAIERDVLPSLGNTPLSQLTTPIVQGLAADMLKRPVRGRPVLDEKGVPNSTLSARTVQYTIVTLGLVLNDAVKQRLIPDNPARGITYGSADDSAELPDPHWLSRDELRVLLDSTRDDRHGPFFTLLATTGLRPSEALALAWSSVDFQLAELRVTRTLIPQIRRDTGRTWKLGWPKTKRSRRNVPLLPEAIRAIQTQRDRQAVERLVAGERYQDYGIGGFVFAHPDGAPYRQDAMFQVLQRTLKRIGLPEATLYSLRHAFATMMLEAGAPMKVVSDFLGHCGIAITSDIYSHVSDSLKRRTAGQLADYLGPQTASVEDGGLTAD